MGRNFDAYPGFHPKITTPNISAGSAVKGVWFFHGYCLDSILGHRKMKIEKLDHMDRLLE